MASGQTYQTTLNIVGNIDKKLISDIKSLCGYSAKVIVQSKEMAAASRAGFDSFAAGAGMAKGAMMSLGASIKAALLPLLGITAGVELFTKFGRSITDSIELFRQYRDQITSFKAVIGESDIVQKHGYSAASLLGQYLENSKEIAQEQGGIFMDQFYTGIQYRIVSQTSLGPKLAKPLTEALVNIAAQTKGSLRNLTQDDVETYTNMVGKAYKSGQLYRLGQLLGLSREDAKAFKDAAATGNKELMTRILLSGTMVKISKEFIEQQIKSPEGQLMKARTQYLEQSIPLGKEWTDIWMQGQTVMYKLGTALIPVFEDLGNVIMKIPIKEMTDSFVSNFKTMYWSMKFSTWDMEISWKSFSDTVKSSEAFKKTTDDIKELQNAWNEFDSDENVNNFRKWVNSVHDSFVKNIDQPLTDWINKSMPIAFGWLHDQFKKMNETQFTNLMTGLKSIRDIIESISLSFQHALDNLNALKNSLTPGTIGPSPGGVPSYKEKGSRTWGDLWNGPKGASGAIMVGESGSEIITPVKNPGVFDDTLSETFKHTDLLSQIASTLQTLTLGSTSYGGGIGGFGGGGGIGNLAPGKTEYGPAIDKPGSPDWDKNSWNRKGSWPALTGLLGSVPGVQDVAMHDSHAWNKYHVRPGGIYIDDQGRKCRFADHTGNRSETNEDYFRMAKGGIVTGAVRALLGESGPEAVIPLNQSGLSSSGIGGHFSPMFAPVINISAGDERLAENVRDVLKHEFQYWMDEAYSGWRRRQIS